MSGAKVTEKGLLEEWQRKCNGANSAQLALGMALLKGSADVPKLRRAHTKSLQDVTDAEAMRAAFAGYTAEVRLSARHTTKVPRVPMQEYADAMKRFQRDYTSLRKTPGAVLARGKELLDLGKRCGQRAVSDVRARFKSLPASPELHTL